MALTDELRRSGVDDPPIARPDADLTDVAGEGYALELGQDRWITCCANGQQLFPDSRIDVSAHDRLYVVDRRVGSGSSQALGDDLGDDDGHEHHDRNTDSRDG
jgi:hypothetical protein